MARVLKIADDSRITPARFSSFDERPVNYFKEVVTDPVRASRPTASFVSGAPPRASEAEKRKHTAELERSRATAFSEGIAQGRKDAEQELINALQLVQQYATILIAERAEVSSKFESQLVSLATQMAAKILTAELTVKPELLSGIVRNALGMLGDAKQVTVRVNPQDLRMLQQQAEDFRKALSSSATLEWRADETLPPGDCMVDSELGTLDARIATQLESLKQQIESSVERKA